MMAMQQQPKHNRYTYDTRPDNDPDLCRLQALWMKHHGSEQGFEPILKQFRNDPYADLSEYIKRYGLRD